MHPLIAATQELPEPGGFDTAICGGFALELFLNQTVRTHADVDVSAWWEERDSIIVYMQRLGWQVFELCGGGLAHRITDVAHQFKSRRNIFCMTDGSDKVTLSETGRQDMFRVAFDPRGPDGLTFVEFLFNRKQNGHFLYARSETVTLPLERAVLVRGGIRYLAPELVLLYKSSDPDRPGYQLDCHAAIAAMSASQRHWLHAALTILYPCGHRWLPVNTQGAQPNG